MKPSALNRFLRRTLLAAVGAKLKPLPGSLLRRASVVIAPHQDDEVLGCGGTICRLRELATEVHIVFLTDGATSHKALYPAAEMAAQRKREALNAAAVMGVAPDHVHFLAAGAQQLGENIPQTAAALTHLLRGLATDQYFIPYHAEPQPDHIAAARICRRAIADLERPVTLLEYPVWFWDHYPWLRETVYGPRTRVGRLRYSLRGWLRLLHEFKYQVDISGVLAQKQSALAAHVSQVKGLRDDVDWPVLDDVSHGDFSACFVRPAEYFVASFWDGGAP
jgi:LmbE family N-acetylglucosaminyl deacetylase